MKKPKVILVEAVRLKALKEVAEYIVHSDDKERDDYIDFCDDNGVDCYKIKGKLQSTHVYAKSLIGMGLKFS